MESDNHEGSYAGRKDKKSGSDRKNKTIVLVMAAAALILLVIAFLLSPLKEMIFPSKTAPAVTLVVAESGPSAERVGYQRILVEALVEGSPEPRVEFNRNDEFGGEGDHLAVLLLAEDETFLLKALATNPLGRAEAELEVFAGIMVGTTSGRTGPAGPGDSGAPAPGNGEDEDEDEPDGADRDGTAPPDGDDGEDDDNGEDEGDTATLRITRINTGPSGVDLLDHPGESYSLPYAEESHIFNIAIIYDGDAVEVEVGASHGIIDRVSRGMTDVSSPANSWPFYFTWRSPANPAGNIDALNVQITVTATGASGASDSKILNIALVPRSDAVSEIRIMRFPVTALTGQVNEDGRVYISETYTPPSIYVGDLVSNLKVRGFISFDLSELAGRRIVDARLRIRGITVGDPASIPGSFIVSSSDYGNSLDAADYRTLTNALASFPSNRNDVSISNDRLIAYIQSVADANRQYGQFVLEYGSVSRNGTADGLSILTEDVVLEVGYN